MNGSISDLHAPVLRSQVVSLLSPLGGKTIVDGTVGLGGHSEALLESDGTVRVIGIDQDREALSLAAQRLANYGDRFLGIHGNFRDMGRHLNDANVRHVDGILLDIGVSSLQLDSEERGFSFRREGPLDMRMDRDAARTARDWLHDATSSEIADVLFRFGEERYARRIARSIVEARSVARIETTIQLADIVRGAVPPQYEHGRLDAATRTFQAIGDTYFAQDKSAEAVSQYGQALALWQSIGDKQGEGETLLGLSQAFSTLGDAEQAAAYQAQAQAALAEPVPAITPTPSD